MGGIDTVVSSTSINYDNFLIYVDLVVAFPLNDIATYQHIANVHFGRVENIKIRRCAKSGILAALGEEKSFNLPSKQKGTVWMICRLNFRRNSS